MKELTDKKTMHQSMLCTTHGKESIATTNFKSRLPEKIAEFFNASHLKHIKLTMKLSVRKLRVFYLSLPGEKEK